MASYRFCRSDDVLLIAQAHNACYRPHFVGLPAMSTEDLRSAAREIDVWTSSCMVAVAGEDPIAVLLATKREQEALIWRVGVHPDHLRQGHGRHLMTSLSSKLAILGPPKMVAEVPESLQGACAFLEACGWRREVEYTDFVLRDPAARGESIEPSDLVIPTTIDELIANEAFDAAARRCWARSPATLVNRKESIRGLAVASDVRIEAYVLFDESGGERHLLALGCENEARREMWLSLLVGRCAGTDPRPLRLKRAHPGEVPFELLRSCGFEPLERTIGYGSEPAPG